VDALLPHLTTSKDMALVLSDVWRSAELSSRSLLPPDPPTFDSAPSLGLAATRMPGLYDVIIRGMTDLAPFYPMFFGKIGVGQEASLM
jgi:hypothetical protein